MSAKQSSIEIDITLDQDKMPKKLSWSASDQPVKNQAAKAMLLSFFDAQSKETLKIDLWTKKMQVVEMDRFMYQTLRSLADTYFRATQNKELAGSMRQFAQYFAEETEIISRGNK